MTTHIRVLLTGTIFGTALVAAPLAQHQMPAGLTHDQHLARMREDEALKTRGAAAMAFDQEKTVHHFRVYADGGAIEVAGTNAADAQTRDQIRHHLKDIAAEFARGDFAKPFATHAEVPPGVRVLQERKKSVSYRYEDTDAGGRVRISTADAQARTAIHQFLRYQIREHATGDPVTAGKPGR